MLATLLEAQGKSGSDIARYLAINRRSLPPNLGVGPLRRLARGETNLEETEKAIQEAGDKWVEENLLPTALMSDRPMLEQLEEAVINNAADQRELALGQSYLARNFWGKPGLIRELTPSHEGLEESS